MRHGHWFLILALAASGVAGAAEKIFDLTQPAPGSLPDGFRSLRLGTGRPGDWRIVTDEAPVALEPLTPAAPATDRVPVLAQLAADAVDERFPILLCDQSVFADFTFSLKFKLVSGIMEQMAGVVFRFQDEDNFYVVRASSLGKNIRFYRVAKGQRDAPIGPELEVPRGVWHALSIECRGNRIRIHLNGNQVIPDLTDNSFGEGKVGLWTKSDAVSYFRDLHVTYTPREPLAQTLVREAAQRYPRVPALTIFATSSQRPGLHIVASTREADLGQEAGKYETQCLRENTPLAGRGTGRMIVTLPLHDRNGEAVAALRIELRTFPGQTAANAVAQAQPIARLIQSQFTTLEELTR